MTYTWRCTPLLLWMTLVLAGCANPNPSRLLAKTIAPATEAQIAGRHEIFIATNRNRTSNPGQVFSGERTIDAAYAKVEVTVPKSHEPGKLELAPNPLTADPARYFAAHRAGLFSEREAFREALAKNIATHGGRALVFIHGYNTSFDAAVYRATQIFHDSGYSGTPILFSWPSSGRVIDYVYDNNSATSGRDALEETLRLVKAAGATRIDIVAHSMGSWVTMEALRQLAIAGERDLGGRLADVVLAAPDIDIDVFKAQMRRYGIPENPFIVLTSQNDRALTLSGFLAGNRPRVGDYRDAKDLTELGVVVVDVTKAASGDWLNHTKFAENAVLVRLLGERLSSEGELDERDGGFNNGPMERLVKGLGQTFGSAAEIVITTPLEVLQLTTEGL